MLDFGTDMTPREDQEQSDDLFTGFPGNKASEPAAVVPSAEVERKVENKKVEIPAVTEKEQSVTKPKRPQIKPPTLPKYHHPEEAQQQQEMIQPALRNNPHFLHRRRKAEDFSTEDKKEVSRILKAARKTSGLSVESVEKSTQIRAHYITALEEADYDNLPQPVYVLAYLRKLCSIYNISEEEEANLIRPWRNIPCELPENLNAAVQQDEENSNGQMLYRIEVILLAAGALIVIGIVTLIIVLIVSYFSGKDQPQTSFENSRVLELQGAPTLEAPEQPPVRSSRR